MNEITRILSAIEEGDARAAEQLLPLVYDELRRLASEKMALSASNPQAAELVKLRYFAGFSNAEAASILGVSPRKANQVWAYARAWLREELGDGEQG